jgi:hypothetical protein
VTGRLLRMRWFWSVVTEYWGDRALPPRKLNLSDLERIAEQMASLLGGTWSLQSSLGNQPRSLTLADLANLGPDERAAVRIHAEAPKQADGAQGPSVTLALSARPMFGGVMSQPLWEQTQRSIRSQWDKLGKPTLRGWRVFPAILLGALALALAGAVVLWVLEPRSLLLAPLVLFALVSGYSAGVPRVNARISRYFAPDRPLPIDFRVREKIREQRTATKEKWKDRAWGFGTALVLVAASAIITLALNLP